MKSPSLCEFKRDCLRWKTKQNMVKIRWFSLKEWLEICAIIFKDGVEDMMSNASLSRRSIWAHDLGFCPLVRPRHLFISVRPIRYFFALSICATSIHVCRWSGTLAELLLRFRRLCCFWIVDSPLFCRLFCFAASSQVFGERAIGEELQQGRTISRLLFGWVQKR
jgi:hypothetical protein